MFYFHTVAHVQYLGEVDFFHTSLKTFFLLSAKIIKIDGDFPMLGSQMYCHLFMVDMYIMYVTSCIVSPFFVWTNRLKTRERICTYKGPKRVKSAKDVPFAGFNKKVTHPC